MQYGIKVEINSGAGAFTARHWYSSEDERNQAHRGLDRSSLSDCGVRIAKIRDEDRSPGMDTSALAAPLASEAPMRAETTLISARAGDEVVIRLVA